jgi:4-cresol dehydrogenase (hydroxylating)
MKVTSDTLTVFQQSNMGIVTKLGMQLYPAPSGIMSCYVDVPKDDDLEHLIDLLCDLRRKDVINNNPVIGSLMRGASMRGPRATFYQGQSQFLNRDELDALKLEMDKGSFHATFALYGDKVIMDHRWNQVVEAFKIIPGARLRPGKQFFAKAGRKHLRSNEPEIQHGPMSTLHSGIPSIDALDCIRFRAEKGGHFSCSSSHPFAEEE